MNNIQIYCKATPPSGVETTYKLDLLPGDPIKITLQAEETGSVSSAYSQTFRIPVTEGNERVFKNACDVNNITFNPRLKISTTISVGGVIFQEGYITLEKVVRNFKMGTCFYEVSFIGEVGDFKQAMGTKTLNDLDTSLLEHQRNLAVIQTSWTAPTYQDMIDGSSPNIGLFGGDVIYPLVEYGYDYDPATNTPDPLLNNTISDPNCGSSFLKNINPLYQWQMKPVVRAKWILDRIFTEAGYSYDSQFFKSAIFYPIYVLGDSSPRGRTLATQQSTAILRSDPIIIPAGSFWDKWTQRPAPYGTPSQNLIMVGPNAGRYEVGSTGLYDFASNFGPVEVYAAFTTTGVKTLSIDFLMDLYDYTNGTTLATTLPYTITRNVNVSTANVSFRLGGAITFPLEYLVGILLSQGTRVGIRTDVAITITAGTGAVNDITYWPQVGLNQQVFPQAPTTQIQPEFSRKMKQIDFILGLVRKFKLVVEPDPADRKRLIIEPWVDWLSKGEKKDWSEKLDGSSDFIFEPIFGNRKRNFILTDKIDSDWMNDNFAKENLKVFGEYKYDSGIEILEGDEKIECPFTPTILGTMGLCDNTNPVIPGNAIIAVSSLSKDNSPYTNTGTRDPIEANPRLCYWNGSLTLPVVEGSHPHWHIQNDEGDTYQVTKWPFISYHTHWPLGATHANFTLAYELETAFNYLQPYYTFEADTATKRYWEPWLDLYYDRPFNGFNNRRVSCKLYLQDTDLIGFRFNTKVFLAGCWWIVSKINNYNLGVGGLTDVELIQLGYTNTKI